MVEDIQQTNEESGSVSFDSAQDEAKASDSGQSADAPEGDPPTPKASAGQGNTPEAPGEAEVVLPPESEKIPPSQSPSDIEEGKPPMEEANPPLSATADYSVARKSLMAGLFLKWKDKMFGRKQARLQKIIEMANKKKTLRHGSGPVGIKVGDVRELLVVSDSTALRYLNQLVKEGRLKRVGKSVDSEYEVL